VMLCLPSPNTSWNATAENQPLKGISQSWPLM
jgi:hypothetical protein